jgi:RNA polymerase sigma-70 factor, ECF subfamily
MSPRQASLVEARFFGGLEMREAAESLEISEATAQRDWRAARAWLAGRLGGAT